MTWLNLGSLGGLIALAFLAWAAGGFRRPVPWRTVLTAGGLMLLLGAVVFWIPWTRTVLIWVNDTVITVLRAGNEGARFLFGPLLNPGETGVARHRWASFCRTGVAGGGLLRVAHGGALSPPDPATHREAGRPVPQDHGPFRESLAGSSNIFIGVESHDRPPLCRDALRVAHPDNLRHGDGGVHALALYACSSRTAGHLDMSIPAAALASKLILPETEVPATL